MCTALFNRAAVIAQQQQEAFIAGAAFF